ncbi:Transcription initiation factor TFIID subunit 11 [Spatholobus suberectus]|nr:Transcription initiation factor TFIID subunit 11 [Spatholobus suberectus]
MKQSKDPFEAAFEESPPESPAEAEAEAETQNPTSSSSVVPLVPQPPQTQKPKNKDEEEEEEEDNMDVELSKLPSAGDPHKMAKMQSVIEGSILTQFTEPQMSRYESFRRAGFQKANMKRLLASITGTQKISVPMTIVVSGIAKMFVGEVIETARIVMKERKESGPIRPCHLREAYRRLKLEGKVFKRSASRLFR